MTARVRARSRRLASWAESGNGAGRVVQWVLEPARRALVGCLRDWRRGERQPIVLGWIQGGGCFSLAANGLRRSAARFCDPFHQSIIARSRSYGTLTPALSQRERGRLRGVGVEAERRREDVVAEHIGGFLGPLRLVLLSKGGAHASDDLGIVDVDCADGDRALVDVQPSTMLRLLPELLIPAAPHATGRADVNVAAVEHDHPNDDRLHRLTIG